jgi:PadR family transcriptional regulator, regulatory protein PadR
MEANRTPRMTIPTQLVLRTLLADPEQERYGVEIGAAAGLPSGTIHPILARLEVSAG